MHQRTPPFGNVENADIVFGLTWGDEGKGKVTAALTKERQYDFVCRWGGGNNAGHTVHVDGRKFVTHMVPSGVFYGIPSIVGPGCVLDPVSFQQEIDELRAGGFDMSLVKVDPRCHIVTPEHRAWEARGTYAADLGTTKRGIGPAYADKAFRTGLRAENVPSLEPYLLREPVRGTILCEGAQGIWLDLDWGAYPYVTSSTTAPHGACSIGFSVRAIRDIIGIAKAYDTRVGMDPGFPEGLNSDPERLRLQKAGGEFGATTGRARKCDWLDLDALVKAVRLSGTSHVIINKVDILSVVGLFRYQWEGKLYSLDNLPEWEASVADILETYAGNPKVMFSRSPEFLDPIGPPTRA